MSDQSAKSIPMAAELHEPITKHLECIRALFDRPEECRITVVVRTPWVENGDVVSSDEPDIEAAIDSIRRVWSFEP